jgi:Tfp pilus assembly ATPase PilU
MLSMDMALLELYQRGEITYDTAMSCCRDANQFRKKTA